MDYKQRLTAYLRTMPRGTKVELCKIVKPENIVLFRKEFISICREYWNEFGKEFSINETYIRRSDEWELSPVVPGQVSINGKIIGNFINWRQ